MSTDINTRNLIRYFQSLLAFSFVSICLFLLSILTFLTIRKQLIPISHLVLPISFGLPPLFNSTILPSYLISSTNLSDQTPLDISHHTYRIELICSVPRSYRNRHLGSFFVQLMLYSTSKQLIIEHSRLILFPYQSDIVRIVRTILLLPLSIFYIDFDRWKFEQVLIERLINPDKSNSLIEIIQLNIIPSSFQIDQCSLHFYVLNLTGFVYLFINSPIITGCLSIFVLFSIYMTFYLIITGLTMLNQTIKSKKIE